MEQELFDWLNSQTKSQGTGLLVAPLSPEVQEDIPAPQESQDMAAQVKSVSVLNGDYVLSDPVIAFEHWESLCVADEFQRRPY